MSLQKNGLTIGHKRGFMSNHQKGNFVAARRHKTEVCKKCGKTVHYWRINDTDSYKAKNLDMTEHSCRAQVKVIYRSKNESTK